MRPAEVTRAVAAAVSTVSAVGLRADDAVVVHNSNRIAVRVRPCDVLVRVAPATHEAGTSFEIEVARRLGDVDAPVARLEPRAEPQVHLRDGFAVTLWTYYEPVPRDVSAGEYAQALERLHASLRRIDLAAPRFTDRVSEAQWVIDNRRESPELADADRELLSHTLRGGSRGRSSTGARWSNCCTASRTWETC